MTNRDYRSHLTVVVTRARAPARPLGISCLVTRRRSSCFFATLRPPQVGQLGVLILPE
jgi:hypothetical protein